jgi:hypothetical protein
MTGVLIRDKNKRPELPEKRSPCEGAGKKETGGMRPHARTTWSPRTGSGNRIVPKP